MFLFVSDSGIKTPVSLDKQPGEAASTSSVPQKSGEALQPNTSQREAVKRRLDSPDSEGSSAKKPLPDTKKSTSNIEPPLQTTTPGTATGISKVVADIRGPTQSDTNTTSNKKGEVDQQIQTASGNDLNERGSIVGESGNRKLQKRSNTFGIVEVSSNIMSRSYVIGFTKKEFAESFLQVAEALYGHTKMQLAGFKHKVIDELKVEHIFFWVVLKLGFNMNLTTFDEKFGKAIRRSKYFIIRTISENIEDESTQNDLKKILEILFINDAGLTTLADLIAKEAQRKEYNDNASTSGVKRKCNFD